MFQLKITNYTLSLEITILWPNPPLQIFEIPQNTHHPQDYKNILWNLHKNANPVDLTYFTTSPFNSKYEQD